MGVGQLSPWKTRTMKFGLSKWRRLRDIRGWAITMSQLRGIMAGGEVRGGVWVPEGGVMLRMGLLMFSFSVPLPCSVLVLCQQSVKTFPAARHCPSLA